jgi:hypothetical protein
MNAHDLLNVQDIAYDWTLSFENLCFELFQHVTK